MLSAFVSFVCVCVCVCVCVYVCVCRIANNSLTSLNSNTVEQSRRATNIYIGRGVGDLYA